jgi:hypothetical protein
MKAAMLIRWGNFRCRLRIDLATDFKEQSLDNQNAAISKKSAFFSQAFRFNSYFLSS